MTDTLAPTAPAAVGTQLRRTARTTGALYLAFFVAGILGTFVVRGQLFVGDDPGATLSNLTGHETLARFDIALELAVVVTQALTAVWFYRLFRGVDSFAAAALVLFGMVNATAILGSAALLATAHQVATDTTLTVTGGTAATVQLLYVASGHLWAVAAVFFGLWLIPMGWLVLRSRWQPQILGWLLVVAGIGYLLSAFTAYLLPTADLLTQLLTLPSIVAELWIMGYLLTIGVHDRTPEPAAPTALTH